MLVDSQTSTVAFLAADVLFMDKHRRVCERLEDRSTMRKGSEAARRRLYSSLTKER